MMEMRRVVLNNTMYDVATMREYAMSPDIYDDRTTAILSDGYVLPIISPTDNSIGINMSGHMLCTVNLPESEEDKQTYSENNIIDMSRPKSYGEVMEKNHQLRDAEREILMNVDSITTPYISDRDTPAMRGLKESIIAKECDIDCYSGRFGANYPNEKRLLKEEDISMKKVIVYGNAMDMKISMTFEDASPDVPNPMGKKVTVVLTGGNEDDGE